MCHEPRVISRRRKPRCIQEIISVTQAGVQRNANILRVLRKHTTHQVKPLLLTFASVAHKNHNTYPHITHKGEKTQQLPPPHPCPPPPPTQLNSPQVHLHKTLSLTKWLHLTSWVGGRTLPVAASYLQILQSFPRQPTASPTAFVGTVIPLHRD